MNKILILFLCLFIFVSFPLKSSHSQISDKKTTDKGVLKKEGKSKKPLTLLNQNGESVEIDSLMGKTLVMTFIYTRCPSPTKCPLIMSRMVKLQKELSDYREEVNFAVVSIDPEYDTPRVLKEYAEINNTDFSNFTLLTGSKEAVNKVVSRFKIYVEEENPGIFAHSLDTFLLDSKGVIRRVFPGAFWEVEVSAEDVIELIEEEKRVRKLQTDVQGETLILN
ncbi:MAG: SCO family protein [Candidatus Scalindua sp.]